MLGFSIGLLTVVLVLDCLFLVLLVLVQLPKKEAGMGQAFGGAATDALFGAGSGNALTKMTKWAAGIFFLLAVVLTLMGQYQASTSRGGERLRHLLSTTPANTPPPQLPATPAPAAATPAAATNAPIQINVPKPAAEAPATNSSAPAKPGAPAPAATK